MRRPLPLGFIVLSVLGLSVLLEAQVRTPQFVRLSEEVSSKMILSKAESTYPKEAREKRIEGSVIVRVYVSEMGRVYHVSALSGDPLLVPAATDAVKKWTYKPFVLYGKPTKFETRVTINFTLANK